MSDSLRDTLEAVVDQAESHPDEPLTPIEPEEKSSPSEDLTQAAPTTTPTTPQEPAQRSSERPEAPKDLAAEQLAAAKKPSASTDTKTEASTEHVTERAPASWTQESRTEWNKVPLPVRQEILRREKQIDEALGQTVQARQLMDTMNQMVQPYMPRLQANQIPPLESIRNLLQADHLLATAPQGTRAAFLAKIIKDYQIDVNELDNALAGQINGVRNPVAGVNEAVQAAIQPLMAPIQEWQRQQAQIALRDQQMAVQAVQRMELDPKYEFFQDVRDYMADIVEMYAKRGLAITAEDAYTVAIQTHPEISKVVYERNNQDAARAALSRGTEAAQRARNAAMSVGSSVPVGGQAQPNGALTLRDTIEAAFTAAGSSGRI